MITPLTISYYAKPEGSLFFVNLAGNCFSKSLLNDLLGLITTDKTDWEFVFEKIRRPRDLYDIIKKARLDTDRRTGVIHLE